MFKKFLLTLASSWALNPLAVITAQFYGRAGDELIILILLCTSTSAPFQQFMNEGLAVYASSRLLVFPKRHFVSILSIQFLAVFVFLIFISSNIFKASDIVVVCLLSLLNTYFSYGAATIYYRAVSDTEFTSFDSIFVGAIPGSLYFLSYVIYCFLFTSHPGISKVILLLTVALPTLCQLLYLHLSNPHIMDEYKNSTPHVIANIEFKKPFYLLFGLVVTSFVANLLREKVSLIYPDYSALILSLLGSVFGIINIFSRISFLENKFTNVTSIFWGLAIINLVVAITLYFFNAAFCYLFAFIGLQFILVFILQAAKKFPMGKIN